MRASWKTNACSGDHGPYVIQLAIADGRGGHSYRPSLPQHRNYRTRADADAVRMKLPSPFIRHGVVIDGITVSGIAI